MENVIKVLFVQPGKYPLAAELGTQLSDLQQAVGGFIEACYFTCDDEVVMILNDEGKLNGMVPNRALYNENGEIIDIVFGPFFICDCSTPEFKSLSYEQLNRYGHMFECPEHFFRQDGEIRAMPYFPSRDMPRER